MRAKDTGETIGREDTAELIHELQVMMEKQPVRFACMGAGGTGKTTLTQAVNEELGIPFVPSVVREIAKAWGFDSEEAQKNASPEEQFKFQLAIFEAFETQFDELGTASWISDRTLLDHLCYAITKVGCSFAPNGLFLRELEEKALKFLSMTTHALIFMPVGVFVPEPDGFRTENEVERIQHDMMLRGYMQKWSGKLTVLHMNVDGVDLRMKHFRRTLDVLLTGSR